MPYLRQKVSLVFCICHSGSAHVMLHRLRDMHSSLQILKMGVMVRYTAIRHGYIQLPQHIRSVIRWQDEARAHLVMFTSGMITMYVRNLYRNPVHELVAVVFKLKC